MMIAMAVTWIVTPWVIVLAEKIGALDLPGGRKLHPRPVPRIGGVAVFAGFVAGLVFGAWITDSLVVTSVSVYWVGVAVAAAGMLLVGFWDDVRGLSFRWKFLWQIVGGVFVWWCGFRIDLIANLLELDPIELGWLSLPATVLWVIVVTNAVNLIDGLDGLAAGIALITSTAVAVIAFVRNDLGITATSVALTGSLIGFLRYNSNPARIFLGDSGSLFLGFVLAVTAMRGSQKAPTIVSVLVPLLVLGLPVLDTSLAVVRRLHRVSRGEGSRARVAHMVRNIDHVFLPDRGHIHHRLLEIGLSHRLAVLILYGIGTVFAVCGFALVMVRSAWIAGLLIGVLTLLIAAFLAPLYLGRWESAEKKKQPETADSPLAPPPLGASSDAR